jgi:hypothetical protein
MNTRGNNNSANSRGFAEVLGSKETSGDDGEGGAGAIGDGSTCTKVEDGEAVGDEGFIGEVLSNSSALAGSASMRIATIASETSLRKGARLVIIFGSKSSSEGLKE